jgi:hypothetical protein
MFKPNQLCLWNSYAHTQTDSQTYTHFNSRAFAHSSNSQKYTHVHTYSNSQAYTYLNIHTYSNSQAYTHVNAQTLACLPVQALRILLDLASYIS